MKSKHSPKRRVVTKEAAQSSDRAARRAASVILDFVQSRIEAFNREQGGGVSVRKDARGYTLIREDTGTPLARLRPKESGRCFEVLRWSHDQDCWRPAAMMGTTLLSLDDALDFIATTRWIASGPNRVGHNPAHPAPDPAQQPVRPAMLKPALLTVATIPIPS